jgi:hypothetical protein
MPADRKAPGAWKRASPRGGCCWLTDVQVIEATLAADGDQTILVVEERGMPLDLLAAYGAGIQVHVEDLAAHLAGRERCDADARWAELQPAYEDLAANVG